MLLHRIVLPNLLAIRLPGWPFYLWSSERLAGMLATLMGQGWMAAWWRPITVDWFAPLALSQQRTGHEPAPRTPEPGN